MDERQKSAFSKFINLLFEDRKRLIKIVEISEKNSSNAIAHYEQAIEMYKEAVDLSTEYIERLIREKIELANALDMEE